MATPSHGVLSFRIAADELRRWAARLLKNPEEFDAPDERHVDEAIAACDEASTDALGSSKRLADSREIPAGLADTIPIVYQERRGRLRG